MALTLKQDFAPIIIIGHWNKYIFTQEWLTKLSWGQDIPMRIDIPLNLDASAKINALDISSNTIGERLIFSTVKASTTTFNLIQNKAIEICRLLSQTPISSFGLNILLDCPIEEVDLEKTGLHMNFGDNIVNSITRTFNLKDCVLTLTISQHDELCRFDCNFHYQVSNIETLIDICSEEILLDKKNTYANDFISENFLKP